LPNPPIIINPPKKKWMRSRLPQLHQHIIPLPPRNLAACPRSNRIPLLGHDLLVNHALLGAHLTVLYFMVFFGEIFEDVGFSAAEDKGSHHCFGAGDSLLGEEGSGGVCGGGWLE